MAIFPEAMARLYRNVYVCRQCKTKRRAQNLKVIAGRVTCRNCGSRALRPVRRK